MANERYRDVISIMEVVTSPIVTVTGAAITVAKTGNYFSPSVLQGSVVGFLGGGFSACAFYAYSAIKEAKTFSDGQTSACAYTIGVLGKASYAAGASVMMQMLNSDDNFKNSLAEEATSLVKTAALAATAIVALPSVAALAYYKYNRPANWVPPPTDIDLLRDLLRDVQNNLRERGRWRQMLLSEDKIKKTQDLNCRRGG